jgi:putative F0F1-ATPase subunit (Ca2+/Mg2+ transporter)
VKRPRYAVIAEASAAGILFPASLVAGYLLGHWIGRALGWGEVLAYVGAGLGVLAAFFNLYRILRRMDRGE